MRTINPILESALANQQGDIILRVNTWNNQADYNANPSTPDHTWTCKAFNLYSTSANAELVTANDYALSDFTVFTIERGVLLSGVEYTIESGLMFVRTYQEDYGAIKITGSSYPNMKISIAGDDTYQNVIEAFCAEIGKTAVFKNSTDAWLGYQFFATGKGLSLNKAELFENLLKQKYTIMVYEESPNNLVFYTQDSYPSSALNAVETDGTKVLAVATAGANGGMTSLNGADWIPQTLPSFYNDVTYSPTLALWVAVGASVCATSPDGITWTARTIPAGTYNSIAWSISLGLFCAVGANVCATSSNGTIWTAGSIPTGNWKSITISEHFGLFTCVSALGAISSNDGTIWTNNNLLTEWEQNTVLPQTLQQHEMTMLSDGRILITGGNTGIVNTYFGTLTNEVVTWVAGSDLPENFYAHTCTLLQDNRILVIGGANGLKTYFGTISGNTITWEAGTAPPEAILQHTCNLLPDNRILITGGNFGSTRTATRFGTISGNTITWASGTSLVAGAYLHQCSVLQDGRILITGGYNGSAVNNTRFGTISGNTITWASGTNLVEAIYGHAQTLLSSDLIFITGGNTGTSTAHTRRGTISGNTITWTSGNDLPEALYVHSLVLLNTGNVLTSGGFANDKTYNLISPNCISYSETASLYVAAGINYCQTSPDGTTWTARTIPAGAYNGITYGNSLFVAVGSSVCATSPDGTTWTARTPANLNTWRDVIYSNTLSLFIAVASNGVNRIMFSADGISWSSTTANADFDLSYDDGPASYLNRDQSAVHYLWRDETASLHTDGDLTNPQWNLGYLESTDAPPSTKEDAYYKIYLKKAPVRLDITDSDKIHFTPYWSIDPTRAIDAMMTISEHLNLTKSPAWYQEIKSISIFAHTEGGALPSTIERVAAYTPLVSTGFDGNLSPAVNNLQALAQAVDDMTLGATPAWGAITGTLSAQTDLQTALNSKQASDSKLTAVALGLPIGIATNYKLSVTVTSSNLTVAIKGIDGNNPSTTNPVTIQIGGAVRTINSALSVTKNAGTNWCNAGGAELATFETDYFVYLGYNATDGVTIGFSRINHANRYDDFSATSTNDNYCAISNIAHASASDNYVLIGRFAATLSAGAGYTWTVPTYTTNNLINCPIYETRKLSYTSTVLPLSGSITTVGAKTFNYTLVGRQLSFFFDVSITTNGTGATALVVKHPFTLLDQTVLAREFVTGYLCYGVTQSGNVYLRKYDETYPAFSGSQIKGGGVIGLA